MTEPKILDEGAVSEIEARPFGAMNVVTVDRVLLTPAERDALCATVKHLRAENDEYERRWRNQTQRNHTLSQANRDLQSQLEQLRAENQRLDNEPRLGCATTRQLLDELTARIEIHHSLDYRTTDPQMKYNLPAGGHTNE